MNCQECRLEITEALDRSTDQSAVVCSHIGCCEGCRAFHDDQLALTRLLEASVDLEPPAAIWSRIEAQIAPQPAPVWSWKGWLEELGALLKGVELRPVGVGLVLTLLFSLGLFSLEPQPDRLLLAELDSFELELSANPFAEAMAASDHFVGAGTEITENPFKQSGNQ